MTRNLALWLLALVLTVPARWTFGDAVQAPEDAPGLEIYFIDVMGGAATLIITPERESILVDSGWPGFEDRDPKRIVHVLKDVAGCERIDHLLTTHWHTDHYGGIEGLTRLVEIGTFWDRGLPEDGLPGVDFPDGPKPDNPLYLAYKKATAGQRRVVVRAGDRFDLGGGASVVVLASGARVIDREDRDPAAPPPANPLCADAPPDRPVDHSDNARSIAFLLELGDFQFFDGGDITWNIEKQLVCPEDLIGPARGYVDLYQVTHHGMDISNHPTLLRTIQPTVTVMNNGPRKGGSAATVHLLRSIPSIQAAYQLHRNAQTGPEDNTDPELIANTDPEGGQFIQVRVEPDGSSYTVQIGTDGPARRFEAR